LQQILQLFSKKYAFLGIFGSKFLLKARFNVTKECVDAPSKPTLTRALT